jgi:alkylhydroperoxidase family enzyme
MRTFGTGPPPADGRASEGMDLDRPSVRIPPATRPPLATVLAYLAGRVTHTEPHRIFTTLARHRRLFRRWLPLGGALLLGGDLPRPDTELLILRTAWNCGSWYEWVQHAGIAPTKGLAPELVAAVADWRSCELWSARQRHLLQAADELSCERVLSDATWALLAAELTDSELIELCFVVGHYAMLAMTLNSLGVEPEPAALAAMDQPAATRADALRDGLVAARRAVAAP